MIPKEEARFGTLPATPWNFTGHLGNLQATLYNVNFQPTRLGISPVFPLPPLHVPSGKPKPHLSAKEVPSCEESDSHMSRTVQTGRSCPTPFECTSLSSF